MTRYRGVLHRQPYIPQNIVINRDTHQSHVMIGTRAYDAHSNKRTGLYLLNNILGGPGMNSLLNIALRERNALVYNVEQISHLIPIQEFSAYISDATRMTRTGV